MMIPKNQTDSPKRTSIDRLTVLLEHFDLQVRLADPAEATLIVLTDREGGLRTACFGTSPLTAGLAPLDIAFSAVVEWGGSLNPLIAALPDMVRLELSDDPESAALVGLLRRELVEGRCGSAAVVNRLGEVLIVRMVRAQIEAGSVRPGLLAGLADARLSRAIVALHERPGRDWRNDDLARIAGLSQSRFCELFLAKVGEPPAAYLRRWRMTLAHLEIRRGGRVATVAHRYGYASPEGFARAFKKQFGASPLALRPRAPL